MRSAIIIWTNICSDSLVHCKPFFITSIHDSILLLTMKSCLGSEHALMPIDILNWDLGKKQGKVARTGRDALKILFANLRKIHCIFMFGWVQEHPRSLFLILGKVSSCLTNFQLSCFSLIEIHYPLIPTSTCLFSPLT